MFNDNSQLFARDFYDEIKGVRDYSFHWQKNENLIMRWDRDDSGHRKNIKTYPLHLHFPDKVTSSEEMDLEMVIDFITNKIGYR
jgi:hypothetical protein